MDLLAKIAIDCREQARGRKPIIVFCGDYVDRGPDSAKVLEVMVQLQRRADLDVRLLKGNHDQAMLDFLLDPIGARTWLRLGGAETLLSYGVKLVEESSDETLIQARDQFLELLPSAHLHLLHQLELMLFIGDYAIVHAGVRPGVKLEAQAELDLLWIRREFIGYEKPFEKVIIHGHTWADDQPDVKPNRIGVDTGAYSTGVLSAARLDGREIVFLSATRRAPMSAPIRSGMASSVSPR